MAASRSAGILLWRRTSAGEVEVLLGHMGGPFWARKEAGAWSVPKGEYGGDEEPLAAALREFAEELGLVCPVDVGDLGDLGEIRQAGGKVVRVWAGEGDIDPAAVVPGVFTMEWPPRSGRLAEFPEVDRVAWLGLEAAAERIIASQRPLLARLAALVGDPA
jgi:predicted NUDIX family NTP pyrophosphohydrolase